MVFEVQHFQQFFTLKTGYLTNPRTPKQFHQHFASIQKTGSDFLVFPLFTDQYLEQTLKQNQQQQLCELQNSIKKNTLRTVVDLDKSLLPSDKSLPRKQFKHLVIKINSLLIENPSYFSFAIGYLAYLGISSILIQINMQNKSKVVFQALNKAWIDIHRAQLSIVLHVQVTGKLQEDESLWSQYVKYREEINRQITNRISISLQISHQAVNQERLIGKWISEGLGFCTFKPSSFMSNQKGFPVLSQPMARILWKCLKLKNTAFSLRIDDQQFSESFAQHIKFISFIFKTNVKKLEEREVKALNLEDYLQNPLQPYSDNLESQTYQIFQFDEPKYDEYQLALNQAMNAFPANDIINVYYIGAGRGGILPKIFSASKSTKRKIHVFLIEKNPYPIQTLKQRIKQRKWEKFVEVIHADMKHFHMTTKPDIFVSELLGGFGDNQLSPQCLLWAEKYITEKTVCIPKKYASFIRPCSYRSIHRKLSLQKRQSYYTVQMGKFYSSFKSEKIWQFQHPLLRKEQALNKDSSCQFKIEQNTVIDGFIGYFTTDLHQKGGYLSIRPQDHSPQMFSWFELYFPFKNSQIVQKGQTMAISMKRVNESQRKTIFYEWAYQIIDEKGALRKSSDWHNRGGKQVAIQL